MSEVRDAFLACAAAARPVVALTAVGDRWREPSALAEMSVGALAAHLVRAVTNVDRFLAGGPPAAQGAETSAAEYFAMASPDLASELNVRVRHTAEEEALVGHRAVVGQLDRALDRVRSRLPAEPADRLVTVRERSIPLDEYLRTRLIELTLHIDDLAVTCGVATPDLPGMDIAIATLIDVAELRHGRLAVLRALGRRERDPDQVLRIL